MILLVDIDHTLSDAFWRDPMIGGSWDEYHAASSEDQPLKPMVSLVRALKKDAWLIIGLTARPAKWRKLTMTWLLKHNIPLDEILMRPDEAFHPAPELKFKLALLRFPDLRKVTMVLDDREDVVAIFKAAGITALQVHGKSVP